MAINFQVNISTFESPILKLLSSRGCLWRPDVPSTPASHTVICDGKRYDGPLLYQKQLQLTSDEKINAHTE